MTSPQKKQELLRRLTDFIRENPGKRITEIAEATGISKTSCHVHLNHYFQRWELPDDCTNRQSRFVWYAKNVHCRIRGAVKSLPREQRVSAADKVREFLRRNPGSMISEVIAGTGLPKTTVGTNLQRGVDSHDTPLKPWTVYTLEGHPLPDHMRKQPVVQEQPRQQEPKQPKGNLPWWWGVEIADLNPV
jgi:hypothetical protein